MSQLPTVPGYRLSKTLGVGGMATVYLAMQESLEREVAIKVLLPQLADNEEFCQRFLKEGRIAASLQHNHLLTVFDIGAKGNVYYMATEYLPDGSLKERIDKGPLKPELAVKILGQLAEGLGFLHSKGFVHRDIKPANILFRRNGSAVLADFGIAKAVNSVTVASAAGSTIGTPHYMSPEQARGEKLDGRSDLYSLGVVFYEMLTGDRPYSGKDALSVALMHVTDPIPVFHDRLGFYQPLIDGLMAKNPGKRFQTADELIEASIDFLPLSQTQARTSAPQPLPPPDDFSTKAISPLKAPPPRAPERQRSAPAGATRKPISSIMLGGMMAAMILVIGLLVWWKILGEAVTVVPPVGQNVPVIDDASRAKLLNLLGSADKLYQNGNVIEPAGANALELYRQAQTIDPANPRARESIERVAQSLLAQINERSVSGQRGNALQFAERARGLFPQDARFQDQIDLLKAPVAEVAPTTRPSKPMDPKLADLYAKAQQKFDSSEYIEPAGSSALDFIKAMLRIDPAQAEALALRSAILDVYMSRIREFEGIPNMDQVVATQIDAALKVDPSNPELIAKRKALSGR